MSTNRKITFVDNYVYHIFNRGLDKRLTFTDVREYRRAKETFKFYQHSKPRLRFSEYLNLNAQDRVDFLSSLKDSPKLVSIMAYCLMPNHFHFLLQQLETNGISKFMANFSNSYTKYFNAKHERLGPLFQGMFKAVFIEDEEQLLHVSRYIHLNPFVASLAELNRLELYPWSSYLVYLSGNDVDINTDLILSRFGPKHPYKKFILDQADYALQLDKFKHLLFEDNV